MRILYAKWSAQTMTHSTLKETTAPRPQPSCSHSTGFKTPQKPPKPWLTGANGPHPQVLCAPPIHSAPHSRTQSHLATKTTLLSKIRPSGGNKSSKTVMVASGPSEFGYQRAVLRGGSSGCRWLTRQQKCAPRVNEQQTDAGFIPTCSNKYTRSVLCQGVCVRAKIASSVQFAAIRLSTVRPGTWHLSGRLGAGLTKAPSLGD